VKVDLLDVPERPGHVRVLFTNDTAAIQWLARPRAVVGRRPQGGFLEFDPPARYTGIRVKRGPYTEEELIALQPGEQVTSDEVRIADFYRLPDLPEIRVRYATGHPLRGLSQAGGPFERVESGWTTVRLPLSVGQA
jgi:hypothetical protein